MDPVNQTSDNSIQGETAGDIPSDGTGIDIHVFLDRDAEQLLTFRRRGKARPLACSFQRCSEEQIWQGSTMDQNNQRY